MKPFNLAAALAGALVVNRDGYPRIISKMSLITPRGGVICSQNSDGLAVSFNRYDGSCIGLPPENDLFLATKTRTVYVNLWDSPSPHYTKYDTLDAAQRDALGLHAASSGHRLFKTLIPNPIAITVEE